MSYVARRANYLVLGEDAAKPDKSFLSDVLVNSLKAADEGIEV